MLDDLGNEVDDVTPGTEETETETPPDRGDNLSDEFLEVDEDVVAALAKDDPAGKDGDKDGDKDERTIPKSRFDEVNNERKALKERLEQLESVQGVVTPAKEPTKEETPPAFDPDAAEDAYTEALTEGDLEKAKTIRKEIRAYERASIKAELKEEAARATTQDTINNNRTDIIQQAFVDYPELDNNSETYNKELVAKINRMDLAYRAEGKPADEAMRLAIADIMPKPVTKDDGKGDVAAKQRNAKAAAAQPPGLGGVGTGERSRSAVPNVETMTEEQFAALPAAEKKRLRGD